MNNIAVTSFDIDKSMPNMFRQSLTCFETVAEGLRNQTIARRLDISTHPVKFHGATTLDKLRARSGDDVRRAPRTDHTGSRTGGHA